MSSLRTACLLMLLTAGSAPAHDGAAPDPADTNAFVRHAFEEHDCIMTEAQLLTLYQEAGFGLMGANNAVIAVSSREDIEVINRDPFTYRYVGSPYCAF